MPKPKDGEDKKSFLSRCMGDDLMNEEYPDNKQRYAVCNSLWKEDKRVGDKVEKRIFPVSELRVSDDEETIRGHAAVFNEWATIGSFREKVNPGCFSDTINNDDIRALFNHNQDYVLGRNTAGTLVLEEDEQGLYFVAHPPNTVWANDLKESISRGDITQCSFSFRVIEEKWGKDDDGETRELERVKLFDVGPVTFPAYPQTDVAVRDIFKDSCIDCDELLCALHKEDRTDSDIEVIQASIDYLKSYLPSGGVDPVEDVEPDTVDRDADRLRRLKML